METATLTEDRTDTKRALAMHQPDGELYLVEYCSLWRDQECVGTRIIGTCGPLARRDLLGNDQELAPSATLFDRIRNWEGDFDNEDAEWMQAEENNGRLDYPIGAA